MNTQPVTGEATLSLTRTAICRKRVGVSTGTRLVGSGSSRELTAGR